MATADNNPLLSDLTEIFTRTRELWSELRGKRIFITGGTGFLGCWLLESLVHANDQLGLGAEAVVLTRDASAFTAKAPHLAGHPAIVLHQGDIRTFDLPDGDFSHIVHNATTADAIGDAGRTLKAGETIVDGTRRVLNFAARFRGSKLLVVSSGSVYDRQPDSVAPIAEEEFGPPDPCDLNGSYADSRRLAEGLAAIYSRNHGIDVKIARCFSAIGPYLSFDQHYRISVKHDGTAQRSYMYAADMAAWLWTILFRGETVHAYNVGSDQRLSPEDLALAIRQAGYAPASALMESEPRQGEDLERYVPSISRASGELGLRVWTSLPEAIRRTITWGRRMEDELDTTHGRILQAA